MSLPSLRRKDALSRRPNLSRANQSQMPLRRPKWNALRGTSLSATTLPVCGTFPSRKRMKHNNSAAATRITKRQLLSESSARFLLRRAGSRHQRRRGSQRGPATDSYKVRGVLTPACRSAPNEGSHRSPVCADSTFPALPHFSKGKMPTKIPNFRCARWL